MEEESLLLFPPKRCKVVNWSRCLICQEDRREALRQGTETRINTFTVACRQRKDDVYKRISKDLDQLSEFQVVWHGKCYQSYTSTRNLSFVKPNPLSHPSSSPLDEVNEAPDERISRSKVDWGLCIFCQKRKHHGFKDLCNVCTFGACKTIEDAAELRGDEVMMIRIKGVDLIAAEAKYHKSCHSQYVSKSNLKQQIFKESNLQEESLYSKAFQTIASDIQEGLARGEAFDMQFLLSSFKVALKEHGWELQMDTGAKN